VDEPELRDVGDGHFVACHFAEELDLRGVLVVGPAAQN
jgi:hypothetical protein